METVTISKDIYEELVENSKFLDCLKAAGVDNWEGYEEAQVMYEEDEEEDG